MKLENKIESEQKDSMINTKIVNEYENWKTITDPKLRKKVYREVNKEKIKLQGITKVHIKQAVREKGKIPGVKALEGITEVGLRIENKE